MIITAVAVLSLALRIGANKAIFTLTDAVFLNPLPVQDAAHAVEVYCVDHATVTEQPQPVIYLPLEQQFRSTMSPLVRTNSNRWRALCPAWQAGWP